MSSLAPIFIFSLLVAFPLIYFLMRFSIQDVKYNSLLLTGLSAISSEIVVSIWLLSESFQDIALLPIRSLAGASLAIMVVVMIDLYITLRSMRKEK